MKNKFVLYISYFFYLIVLGQGCSGISNKPHLISFSLPNIEMPQIASLKGAKITSNQKSIPREDLYRKAIELNSSRQLAVVSNVKAKDTSTEVISKNINIPESKEFNLEEVEELKNNEVITDESALSLKMHIQHRGFKIKPLNVVSIAETYNEYLGQLSERLAKVEEKKAEEKKILAQYDPTSEEAIANFERQQLDDVVKAVESTMQDNGDDIVFIDYSKEKEDSNDGPSNPNIVAMASIAQAEEKADEESTNAMAIENSLEEVAKLDISHRVSNVIKREMGSESTKTTANNSYADLLKKFNRQEPVTNIMAAPERDEEESKLTIHALHTEFGKGMEDAVHNFSLYSASDNNKVYEDYNEGKIEYSYSLNGYSGVLRATLVKNFYVRTTIEAPLTGEYSNIEVPLIDVKSLEDYLGKNELSGYGGYYLVDLGDYFEDVEISSDQNIEASYEQRVYLNEDFKIVKSGKDYRYILFLGVIPGNIRVQYLGTNRTEASKITFVAPDEITFDIATAMPSHEVVFDLTLKNTLGVQNVPLDLDTQKMTTFVGQQVPSKKSAGKYSLNVPWGTKGSRTYLEVNHLSSPIFVGMDGNGKLELPSIEFVQEILKSFSIDELHSNECMVHINFANKEVVDVKVRGESAQGPMTYEQSFLDKDGVFTKYVSPMSNKLFILGNEEGIYTMQVNYADGKKDFLRTYCSPGTYLLEQL